MSHLAAKAQFVFVRIARASGLQFTCGCWLRCALLWPALGVGDPQEERHSPSRSLHGMQTPFCALRYPQEHRRAPESFSLGHKFVFLCTRVQASITKAQRDSRPCPPAAAQPGGACCWMPAGRLQGKQFLLARCVIYLREVCQALKGQRCSLSLLSPD